MMSKIKKLTFEAIAIRGDVAYASDYNGNGLFKVNMNTQECEFITIFDGESVNNRRLHCEAIWIDSKIYFIPGSANRIHIFEPKSGCVEIIEIPLPKPKQFPFYTSQFKFIKAIQNGGNLWLLPCSYPGIIKFNIQSKNVQLFDKWLEEDEYFFRKGIGIENKKIFMANGKSNSVLMFDMEKETGKIQYIGINNNGVMSMCKVGDEYWFAPRLPGAIVVWNPLKNVVTEYDVFPNGFEEGNIVFSNTYVFMNKIFFIPAKSNCVLAYNDGEFQIDDFDFLKEHRRGIVEYLFETEVERYFRVTGIEECDIYFKINKKDNTIGTYGFYYYDNGEREKNMIASISKKQVILKETMDIGLNELITGLV